MNDEHTTEPTGDTPPPPPVDAAPPPPGGAEPPSGPPGSDNRTLMIILAYLYFFSLVPLFVEKEDSEVQWHAKNGLVLLGADLVLAAAFTVLSVGIIGCILAPVWALLHFALFVIRIIAIVKGTQGERTVIPVLSPLADKF